METTTVLIRPAVPADYAAAARLLEVAKLPLQGLREHFAHAIVAERDGLLVGCVALEVYGSSALLRSLAVAPERRGEGLGERLAAGALAAARESGARDVYVLTETAEKFFPRFGFSVEDRSLAPHALRQSEEFKTACPASAVLMHARVSPS